MPLTAVFIYDQSPQTHTHTRLTALFPGLPRWASTGKVKRISILVKQETVSGSGISWATCKSAPRSRQINTPASHHSVFYRPDALPVAQPTVSKHRRNSKSTKNKKNLSNCKKSQLKGTSSYKLFSIQALALNTAIIWRARLAWEKLHCADFVHNPLIIMAVTQNCGDGNKLWHSSNHGI